MLKVASFNVNSLRARLPIVLSWLEEIQPDVLAVQETKVQDAEFPDKPFDNLGYHCAFKGQKSYNGVALFSRKRPEHVSFGFSEAPQDEARLARADIAGMTIVNTYVPQGYLRESDKFAYKLAWFKRLRHYFEAHFSPSDPVVWLGDLNVAPEAIDVHDPKRLLGHVCFCPEVSEALYDVMGWGFTDTFRKHCDAPGWYTFWDYRARRSVERNQGWRIDQIMATTPLAQRCVACTIDKNPRLADRPSDHTPIMATFDL